MPALSVMDLLEARGLPRLVSQLEIEASEGLENGRQSSQLDSQELQDMDESDMGTHVAETKMFRSPSSSSLVQASSALDLLEVSDDWMSPLSELEAQTSSDYLNEQDAQDTTDESLRDIVFARHSISSHSHLVAPSKIKHRARGLLTNSAHPRASAQTTTSSLMTYTNSFAGPRDALSKVNEQVAKSTREFTKSTREFTKSTYDLTWSVGKSTWDGCRRGTFVPDEVHEPARPSSLEEAEAVAKQGDVDFLIDTAAALAAAAADFSTATASFFSSPPPPSFPSPLPPRVHRQWWW